MPRQGVQVQYPVTRVLDIQPVLGMFVGGGPEVIPLGASPDMQNFCVRRGLLRKRPGYAAYTTTIGGIVIGLFSHQDAAGTIFFHGIWVDGVKRWDSGTSAWVTVTGTTLTGGDNELASAVLSQGDIAFSQGVNGVYLIDVSADTYAALSANCPPAKYLERFGDRLVLGHTYESSAYKRYRTRRSIAGDHTDWTGIGSGFRDATDMPLQLTGLKRLGNYLAIYYEQSIELVALTGIVASPFQYETRIEGVGLLAPPTLVAQAGLHRFLGTDDFYEFDGNVPRPIGGAIRDAVVPNLQVSYMSSSWAVNLFDMQEYLAFVCTTGAIPTTVWVYNWGRQIWFPWTVSGHKCGVIHRLTSGPTIDGLSGTIDSQSWEIDAATQTAAVGKLFTGGSDGLVYVWGEEYMSDAGSSIPCRWVSRDITAVDIDPSQFNRQLTVRRVVFVVQNVGSTLSLNVSFSTDSGASWDGPYTGTLSGTSANWAEIKIDRMVTGDRIRLKVENNTADQCPVIQRILVDCELRGQLRQ